MFIFTKSFTVWICRVLSSLAGYHVGIYCFIFFLTGKLDMHFHSLTDLFLFQTDNMISLFQERQNDTTRFGTTDTTLFG